MLRGDFMYVIYCTAGACFLKRQVNKHLISFILLSCFSYLNVKALLF